MSSPYENLKKYHHQQLTLFILRLIISSDFDFFQKISLILKCVGIV